MTNKKYGIIIAILVVLLIVVIIGAWAFSKYTTTVTGNGSATVARWSFEADFESNGVTVENISLTDTTLNGKVTNGKIAPGTDGSFAIEVDASGSDVAIDYTIEISNLTNFPTNLKFYSDAEFNNPLTLADSKFTFTDSIPLADVGTPKNKVLYWQWKYETTDEGGNVIGDETDVSDAGKTPSFNITVVGVQQDPS